MQRALGIVVVGHRRPEHRHDGVADELLHEALVPLDGLRHLAKQIALECAHVLGVGLLTERREAGEIGEEHGHQAAVAVEGGGGG